MADHPDRPQGFDRGPDLDWRDLARRLARGRWTILACLAAALAIGAAIAVLTPPIFTAQTTLEIDREGPRITPINEAAPVVSLLSADEFYQTQYGLLRGRALAARVAQTLQLDRDNRFIDRIQGGPALFGDPANRSLRLNEVIRLLRRRLSIAPLRGSRLVTIGFTSPDPTLSTQIAAAFAQAFIDGGRERRLAASAYARGFLEAQLTLARSTLETGEKGLASYATAQGVLELPGPAPGRSLTAASLEALNTALDGATADRILAEQRWRQGAAAGAAAPEVLASPTVQQIRQERAKLAAEYQDHLSVYKPDYPDMRQLMARINETDRQLARETAETLQSLRSRYEAALGAETALAEQVAHLRAQMIDLRSRGVGYDVRSREVDVERAVYDGLLQRYRDVALADGAQTGNVFVVDPATPPDRPTWPRPWLVMLLATLIGIGAGVGWVLLASGMAANGRE